MSDASFKLVSFFTSRPNLSLSLFYSFLSIINKDFFFLLGGFPRKTLSLSNNFYSLDISVAISLFFILLKIMSPITPFPPASFPHNYYIFYSGVPAVIGVSFDGFTDVSSIVNPSGIFNYSAASSSLTYLLRLLKSIIYYIFITKKLIN